MTEPDKLLTSVDNFIDDLLNGNLEIVYSKAKDLFVYDKEKGILGREIRKDKSSLSNALGHALTSYQESKNNPQLHLIYAEQCFKYIIWANTHQVIKRTGLAKRIKELIKENGQLKEEKNHLEKENQRLTQLNDALHETWNNLGFKRLDSNQKGDGEEQ